MSPATPFSTTGFLLSKIGQSATLHFAGKLKSLDLRPKHCGLLATVAAIPSSSQQELGRALGLVPSAIVSMIDDLEEAGALRRVEDPDNRRRYSIELTSHGRDLLEFSGRLAEELDQEILRSLTLAERQSLKRLLGKIFRTCGSPSPSLEIRPLRPKKPAIGARKATR